ncbi:MAG: hypothetical protein RXR41_04115 [Candidatus Marsarchaeota archaeon]
MAASKTPGYSCTRNELFMKSSKPFLRSSSLSMARLRVEASK